MVAHKLAFAYWIWLATPGASLTSPDKEIATSEAVSDTQWKSGNVQWFSWFIVVKNGEVDLLE